MIDFIKKYKLVIIVSAVIIAALTAAFISGGSIKRGEAAPDSAETQTVTEITEALSVQSTSSSVTNSTSAVTEPPTTANNTQPVSKIEETAQPATEKTEESTRAANTSKTNNKYNTDPIPAGKPQPVEPEEQTTDDGKIYCTFSISCATILDNMDDLDPSLTDLIPQDGWIIKPEKIEVDDGESVFDILVRVCKDKNIHMEYSWTPIYNSAYIEGIANIYEYDCGDQSGWIYKVNDWAPNYGCSRYVVSSNDVIEWKYTCDLGKDV